MKLISVQSRGNRTITIECRSNTSSRTGQIKTQYYLKKKQIMWKDGLLLFLQSYSEAPRQIVFKLAEEWLNGATA